MTPFVVEECRGEQTFPNLASAQQAALQPLAVELAATLRSLISQGILTVENGRVIIKDGSVSLAPLPHTTSSRAAAP